MHGPAGVHANAGEVAAGAAFRAAAGLLTPTTADQSCAAWLVAGPATALAGSVEVPAPVGCAPPAAPPVHAGDPAVTGPTAAPRAGIAASESAGSASGSAGAHPDRAGFADQPSGAWPSPRPAAAVPKWHPAPAGPTAGP